FDIGNHGDDVTTAISLPFVYSLYGVPFSSVNVVSNGNLQFNSASTAFTNTCLPTAAFNYAIFSHWDDLRTDAQPNCALYPGGLCGVFTAVTGTAPNRRFVIEWRATYFTGGQIANFEAVLYENGQWFDLIYGTLSGGGSSATVGVQRDTGSAFTQ